MNNPVKFKCGKVAPNPFAVASLTNRQSNSDGTLHDRELVWLRRRAAGGYGIVNTCAVHVQANGQGWAGEWGIFDDRHIDGFRRTAEAVHAEGALLLPQIFHGGMRADDSLFDGPARSCVDTVYKHRGGSRDVKALTEAEINTLVADFAAAAKRAEEAGCDGVEVHGAHGYILTQFLCPTLNTRTDAWGGPALENRARLTRAVVRAVRQAVRPDFIVGVRLSPEPGYEQAGWNMDPDENVQVAQWLVEDGIDFVSVSLFGHSPTHVTAKHKEAGSSKPLAQVFRDALPKDVVVMCCGGIKSGRDVQTLLDLGVDVVVTGKTAISTPDFPAAVQKDPDFAVSILPPYSRAHLASVDVSEPFIDYLASMRMVQG